MRAVADVCRGNRSVQFQFQDNDRGYSAIASPISAAAGSVGVIILLTKERLSGERLLSWGEGFAGPLDALARTIAEMDPSNTVSRAALAEAVAAIDALRKHADELMGMLAN